MEIEGAIEVPGEANPLTERILFDVLSSASSSDSQRIQTGTQQLQTWETARGYYPLLQTVFIDNTLPLEVRYLAIIQLKNGIDKYWRKTATNAVSKEDKAAIRSRLLESGVNEANERLALQNALVIAKIARFEYPTEWPEAIPQILQILRASSQPNANPLHLPRALLIILQLVKDLSTARLRRSVQSLQAIAPEIFHVLGSIYLERVQAWEASLQQAGANDTALQNIEISRLTIKALRRLIISGFDFPHRDTDIQQFWVFSQQKLADFLRYLSRDSPLSVDVKKRVGKHLTQLNKLHLEMARTHAAAFVLLPNSLPLLQSYWTAIAELGETFGIKSVQDIRGIIGRDGDADEEYDEVEAVIERMCQKGLLIIRACVKMVFNPAQTFRFRKVDEKEEQKQAKQILNEQMLSEQFVKTALELIITKFFVFRPSDLKQWEEEPEEWEKMEEGIGDDFDFSLRSAAEKLFLDLAINFKGIIVEPLVNVFHSVSAPDSSKVLLKDSVYTAVGLAAPVLFQHLDLEEFIRTTAMLEVKSDFPGANLLRRRIAILLGQWIPIKSSDDVKRPVYHIYELLLDENQPMNDQVVRVTAGRHFKNIADEFEFKPENFLPYAPTVLTRIMSLIAEVDLPETKLALLETISVVVERLERHIVPYANNVVDLLPPLWEQSGQENLMKQQILVCLARLVKSMGPESVQYHQLMLPIIKGAIEPGSETQLYLLEDALDLWSSIVEQTAGTPPDDLLSLAGYLLEILDLGSEAQRKSLEITEQYILLAPDQMLHPQFRFRLLATFEPMLGTLKAEPNAAALYTVERLIQAAAQSSQPDILQQFVRDMLSTEFLHKIISGLRESYAAHQTTGPNAMGTLIDGVIETDYFAVLTRLGTTDIQVLLEAINAAVPEETLEQTMKWLLTEWFDHLENVHTPPRKKLMAMVLTKMLSTGQEWILIRLQELMGVWTDVIMELTDGENDKTVDSLVWTPPDPSTMDLSQQSPEDARKMQWIYSDVVHTVNLVALIREHLQGIIQATGGSARFQELWLVNVDKEVVNAFSALEGVM